MYYEVKNAYLQNGYKQLVDNASFQIDDINNINLYNIDVEKNSVNS